MKCYRERKIKLKNASGEQGVAHLVGGERPYIWFGTELSCLGWVDTVRAAKALRRMCDDYLESRSPEPHDG